MPDILNQNIECKKCKCLNKITSNYCKECGEKLEKNNTINISSSDLNIEKLADKKSPNENSKISTISTNEHKNSNIDEIMKWAELLEKGLITKEEFEKKKLELM
jgi:DNA-directed RNA polymerase alpha subunit